MELLLLIWFCPNHRMPVRALRLISSFSILHTPFLSESSNARQGIKTGPPASKSARTLTRPNHRMPVRALRQNTRSNWLLNILESESSNARQGIKTFGVSPILLNLPGSESSNARQGIKTCACCGKKQPPQTLSESSNARQGIKTLGDENCPGEFPCVRIIECPSGH